MGYWTCFDLKIEGEPADVDTAEKDLIALDEYFTELVTDGTSVLKWYDWDTTMAEFARNHPNVLIILDGNGEAADDSWQWRAKGDESEYRELVLPPLQNRNLLSKSEKEKHN